MQKQLVTAMYCKGYNMMKSTITKEQLCAAALTAIPGIGSRTLSRLVLKLGSIERVWNCPVDDLRSTGLSEKYCTAISQEKRNYDFDKQLRLLSKYKTNLVTLWDNTYPELLKNTYNPPAVLYYCGSLPSFQHSVAVVGARKATPYGRNTAQSLAEELSRNGVMIVSGGARGIDTKAHIGALESGQTSVILANGLDIAYPAENKKLFADIIDKGGAIFSEYPFGTTPSPRNFPARNRIIAGLCHCVVIVEAALRSGSLITADFALEEGRDVFAVPGSIFSEMSKGTNALLRKGAIALTCADDILSEYGWNSHCHSDGRTSTTTSFTKEEEIILSVLSYENALSREHLIQHTGILPAQLSSVLLKLQLGGFIEEINGCGYIKKRIAANN